MNMQMHNVKDAEQQLRAASKAYYNGTPIMIDREFDELWQAHNRWRYMHPDDPCWADTILDHVGAPSTSGFAKVKHTTPMLSLDNVFAGPTGDLSELAHWFKKTSQLLDKDGPTTTVVVLEPKVDGLSLRVTYKDSEVVMAATRGNGEEGDDVTANVLASGMVPTMASHHSHANVVVDGEVFMDFKTFERLNEARAAAGEELYANPRNAAAGSLRLGDPNEVAKRGLRFLAHGIKTELSASYRTDCEALGIDFVKQHVLFLDQAEFDVDEIRAMLPTDYPTDGAVFKIDRYDARRKLGSHSRAPKWAVALKFQQEQVDTKIKAITVQVGRSGRLTPVAELAPVEVDGTIVSRATLHNETHIQQLGLCVGDAVRIRKAGAIIPEIMESLTASSRKLELYRYHRGIDDEADVDTINRRVAEAMEAERPPFDLRRHINGVCPSCESADLKLAPKSGRGVGKCGTPQIYVCGNTNGCPAQMAGRIEHMAGRDRLDLDMLGGEAADAIADIQLTHPFQVLFFTEEQFAKLTWKTTSGGRMTFGAARAKKVMAAIERTKSLPLDRWIAALGIHTIGKNTSKELTRLFETREELIMGCLPGALLGHLAKLYKEHDESKSSAKMRVINGLRDTYHISGRLGPVSIGIICAWVADVCNRDIMRTIPDTVKSANYDPTCSKAAEAAEASAGLPLDGKKCCITGTLSVPRSEISLLVQQLGGVIVGSVSGKTDYLIYGEKAGSKLAKAEKLGVGKLNEEELRALLQS